MPFVFLVRDKIGCPKAKVPASLILPMTEPAVVPSPSCKVAPDAMEVPPV